MKYDLSSVLTLAEAALLGSESKVILPIKEEFDLLSEDDWEGGTYTSTSEGDDYRRHNIQDVSEVQSDKKGQFVTTLGDDEITPSLQIGKNPKFSSDSTIMENALRPKVRIARDTIRPRNSKNFKGY